MKTGFQEDAGSHLSGPADSHAEEGAEFFSEEDGGAGDRHGEEGHGLSLIHI